MNESKNESNGLSRRDFIKGSAVAAAFPAAGAEAATLHNSAQENSAGQRKQSAGRRKPNIVLYISD
ncbi:MAG TPA: twin-arginine translocation signal domain-containing protein, partial [Acidobacteriaceae bacterium]|nr:twin-arginine translocation signal domain-containing protein [Acidobacteriaceae bacterium]